MGFSCNNCICGQLKVEKSQKIFRLTTWETVKDYVSRNGRSFIVAMKSDRKGHTCVKC